MVIQKLLRELPIVLEYPGEAIEAITRSWMEKVERDADDEANARRIKDLVRHAAGVSPARI